MCIRDSFRQHCETCVDLAESTRSDAYVSGQMLRDLREKLRVDRASRRAGAQRKLLLRKCESDAVYSNLIVRDPPVGLRALLARFRVAPRLRDARPSPPKAPKPDAIASQRHSSRSPRKGTQAARRDARVESPQRCALRGVQRCGNKHVWAYGCADLTPNAPPLLDASGM